MRKKGGDWVELGLGLEPVPCDVNLILAPVDEICCHHLLFPIVLREVVHKAQADVALQCVAVGTAGGLANILPVSVNGLPPPWPEVQVCVMVVQDEHGEAFIHPVLPLLKQGISTNEIHPLGKERQPGIIYTLPPGPCTAHWEPSPVSLQWGTTLFPHPMKNCIYKLPSEHFCNITGAHVSSSYFIHTDFHHKTTQNKNA